MIIQYKWDEIWVEKALYFQINFTSNLHKEFFYYTLDKEEYKSTTIDFENVESV